MTDADALDEEYGMEGPQNQYADTWYPDEVGDFIEGEVVERREDPFEDGNGPVIEVRQDDGSTYETATHSILTTLIEEQDPTVGNRVAIRYEGERETSGPYNANDYTMGVKENPGVTEETV